MSTGAEGAANEGCQRTNKTESGAPEVDEEDPVDDGRGEQQQDDYDPEGFPRPQSREGLGSTS